jgi:AraC-like DNA-binding protein
LQPVPFKIQKSKTEAFKTQEDRGLSFYSALHYHPEYQMTLMLKGSGILYAGNSSVSFSENDFFFIGSNVPHLFKNVIDGNEVLSVSLFFSRNSFGYDFFEIAEMKQLQDVISDTQKVIKYRLDENSSIYKNLSTINDRKGHHLLIIFLNVLAHLDQSNYTLVNNLPIEQLPSEAESNRLGDVLNYIFENYIHEISVEEIAKKAHLSKSQFSYFFKLHTDKTFVQFLNEVRIENACQRLIKSEKTIENICYESGFNNVSHFVRQFKKVKGCTPSEFRSNWGQ